MILVNFLMNDDNFIGFDVSGHAGYANAGNDIVCSAVTSSVELVANGLTEILKSNASIQVNEAHVKLLLPKNATAHEINFIKALRLHIEILREDYPNNIVVNDVEV